MKFAIGFIDRLMGTEDGTAAGRVLEDLPGALPLSLPSADRALIRAGAFVSTYAPAAVAWAARRRVRGLVEHLLIDSSDPAFGRRIAAVRRAGFLPNVNLLGESVLGEAEADRRRDATARLLARPDVDHVSVKISSLASQMTMWGFEESTAYAVERLRPLYRAAALAPAGSAFINLDIEHHADSVLTPAVFTRLLSEPELRSLEAGIVVQGYLPDSLGTLQRLSAFARHRSAHGGADIRVRLVKGANRPVESVRAEVAGWPSPICADRASTDANYKRLLHWILRPARMRGLRLGVASHNLFDLAFAHRLAELRGTRSALEFEMLHGMAEHHAAAVRSDLGPIRLYVPAVSPAEFDSALSYLIRRLDENAQPAHFMSSSIGMRNGDAAFRIEEQRFLTSVDMLRDWLLTSEGSVPQPAHRQDRSAEAAGRPSCPAGGFINEPDTDPVVAANRRWTRAVLARIDAAQTASEPAVAPLQIIDSAEAIQALTDRGRRAAAAWQDRDRADRAQILLRAAELFVVHRGDLLAVMAAEGGKSLSEADPEVSEAIDLIRFYAHGSRILTALDGARFDSDALVLVTPPWNFPAAIPAGMTVAPLAAGAAVLHKPSPHTPRCSVLIAELLWEAGIPRDLLQLIAPGEGHWERELLSHPSLDRVLLTGGWNTAALFRAQVRHGRVSAETSGKNAIIITPSADRDEAIAALVGSAFSHSGQKCSAASLGILVGSVYGSQRFRRQLRDAVESLPVGLPSEPRARVGPLIEEPSGKLLRALTRLDPGERWLVQPQRIDDTGRLWSPGVKDGVIRGSFFHRTECFGPVLGLMRADSLDHAIDLQNEVDLGLTAGIHTLRTREAAQWLSRVEAGNLYVNRGITGAVVARQPFGGWKRSNMGGGAKAGGPDHLLQFGRWTPEPFASSGGAEPVVEDWLAAAQVDDRHWHRDHFGTPRELAGLSAEANILRHIPCPVAVRVTARTQPWEVERIAHAAALMEAEVAWSLAPELSAATSRTALRCAAQGRAPQPDPRRESAAEFAQRVAHGEFDHRLSTRIRVLGECEPALQDVVRRRPEVDVFDGPVTGSGRVEMRVFALEQAVAITLHRYGSPSPDFHELAAQVRAGAHRLTGRRRTTGGDRARMSAAE